MNTDIKIDVTLLDAEDQLFKVVLTDGTGGAVKLIEPAGTDDELLALVRKVADATGLPAEQVRSDLGGKIADARRSAASRIAEPAGYQPQFMTSAELEDLVIEERWLVDDFLVADEPIVIGGPVKSMKTSISIDLAISLGSGRQFLNRFNVPARIRVAVISGESGRRTIQRTAISVAKSKGVRLRDCDVLWDFRLPRLSDEAHLLALQRVLREQQARVVILDPAYLSLVGGRSDVKAENMFQMGPLLLQMASMCLEVGATPVIVHHAAKTSARKKREYGPPFAPLDLEDLAYAGFAEFARQWVLTNPRETYDADRGLHKLNVEVGGSAGQSGSWAVDIEQGKYTRGVERRWLVSVRPRNEAIDREKEEKAKQSKADKEAREKESLLDAKEKIVKALERFREKGKAETREQILAAAEVTNKRLGGRVIDQMWAKDEIVLEKVRKRAGPGSRLCDGYRLATPEERVLAHLPLKRVPAGQARDDDRDAFDEESTSEDGLNQTPA